MWMDLGAAVPIPGRTGATAVQVWTLIVASFAVIATLVSAYLLRRTGRGTVIAAERAAAASERSAQAAANSAQAAQDSVSVNRETSAGVAQRALAGALSKRFQDAATQLGHEKPPVRLAGAYALARLADDWPEQRQACVDVLCAYLRVPVQVGGDSAGEHQVRLTVVSLIREHLRPGGPLPKWWDLELEFAAAELTDFDLSGAVFQSSPSFRQARFIGSCHFDETVFRNGADFSNASLEGSGSRLSFARTEFRDRGRTKLEGFRVGPEAQLTLSSAIIDVDCDLYCVGSRISGKFRIELERQERKPGRVQVGGSHILSGGSLAVVSYFEPSAVELRMPFVAATMTTVETGGELFIQKRLVDAKVVHYQVEPNSDGLVTIMTIAD